MNKGIIQVYSGNGKGKTTAAVGQAIRAVSAGVRVLFIFFNKNSSSISGEYMVMKNAGIIVRFFAERYPSFFPETTHKEMRQETLNGLEYVSKCFKENIFDLIVMDEILISVRDGFISEDELLELMKSKPENIELILTGRGITEKIKDNSDLVTDNRDVKHPYQKGVKWRQGIEK
jgi:cob(I)alamin adenosyltransferase